MIMINISKELSRATIYGPAEPEILDVTFDSREVRPGSLFVATRGTQVDSHEYIQTAIEAGATAIVCETLPETLNPAVCYAVVTQSAAAGASLASALYGHPSRKLRVVGVTGTNGKTTVATLLYDLYTAMGHRAGLLSTVVYRVAEESIDSTHTTPDPLTLNRLLARMVDAGCEYCFMEVSSHSIVQQRVAGIRFVGGVFTNITHDHLDYHGTFAEYIKAKKSFFDELPSDAFALTNIDDRNGEVMLQNSRAHRLSYSLLNVADCHCRLIESHMEGMLLDLCGTQLWVRFIGRFNAYNLTAIYGTAVALGADSDTVLRLLSTLTPVSGRFEYMRADDGRLAIIDYAHTPDALQNVIDTINQIIGRGHLITVVGCGGNRDATKRPIMAQVAAEGSHRVILTSDNPRREDPQDILDQMQAGLNSAQGAKTLTIVDRRQAIRAACALASKGDIILVAGKGHEPYQEINGVRHHFDDHEQVREAFGTPDAK